MKRALLGLVVTSFVASQAFAETKTTTTHDKAAATTQKTTQEETWTGKIEKKDATNVEFVAGGQKYDISGPVEAELTKEVGKEVKLTGVMSADKKSIQAMKAEPASTTTTTTTTK